jgi:hypothetical protein
MLKGFRHLWQEHTSIGEVDDEDCGDLRLPEKRGQY